MEKPKTRKFNKKEFEKKLESFNQWEKRKKERIEKIQKEKEEKKMNNKKKNNIHNKKKIPSSKLPDIIERLYNIDITKRKQNHTILVKVYTPTFTPCIFTKKGRTRRPPNRNDKNEMNNSMVQRSRYHNKNSDDDDEDDDDDDDDDNNYRHYNNNYNTIHENNYNNIYDNLYEDVDDDSYEGKNKHHMKTNSQRQFKKVEIISPKKKNKKNKKIHSDNEDGESERVVIENAFRNRLFKHKNK